MEEYLINGSLSLEPGGRIVIDDGRGMFLYAWSGRVWVTQEGEFADRVLGRGEWMRIAQDGRCVAVALAPSAVALTSPHGDHGAGSIQHAPGRGDALRPIAA